MVKPDLFSKQRQDWISEARQVAEKIAIETGKVDIEDVLAVCPRPRFLHPNTTGKIFTDSVFRVTGFKKSCRTISRGRIICVWELKPELYPKQTFLASQPVVREYGDSY